MFDYSILAKRLNNHKGLTRFLLCLPTLITIIYVFFFLNDTLNAFGIISINNSIIDRDIDIIREIDDYTEEDNTYTILTTPTETKTLVLEDDSIITVQITPSGKIKYVSTQNNEYYIEKYSTLLFSNMYLTDDGVEVELANTDNTTLVCDYDTDIVKVYVTDEGNYRVEDLINNTTPFIMYVIDGLNYNEDGTYTISDIEYIHTTSLEAYPCTNLPTSLKYIDMESEQILQNNSKNFVWSYLLDTKVHFVLLMILCILILFTILNNKENFNLDVDIKPYYIVNNISLVCIFLAAIFAYILLH